MHHLHRFVHRDSQIADWLEQYANSMELDYWLSAKVVHARRVPDPKDKSKEKWEVTVRRGDQDRVLYVDHVVFAVGFGGYTPNMPKIPGMVRQSQSRFT